MTRREAVDLAKGIAAYLYKDDPEHVEGGCSDVSELIAAFLERQGVLVRVIYGNARRGRSGELFMHAWLDIDGERFDPVLWVFYKDKDLARYRYEADPGIATVLYCEMEEDDEASWMETLETAWRDGKLRPERPELIDEHQPEED